MQNIYLFYSEYLFVICKIFICYVHNTSLLYAKYLLVIGISIYMSWNVTCQLFHEN